MDQNTLFLLAMVVSLFAAIVLTLAAVLYKYIPALRDSVPADFGHKSLDLAKTVLLFGLNSGAAQTPSLQDDELLINGLRLLGAEVTGSPETGYTIVVPPKS